MTNALLMQLLKNDLQLKTTANDAYLQQLLNYALSQLKQMGITIAEEQDEEGVTVASDEAIQVIQMQFASYLFRKRAGDETAMPRFLKRAINSLLFNQKMGASNDL